MAILQGILIFVAIFALAGALYSIISGLNIISIIKNNISSPTPKSELDAFLDKVFTEYMNGDISYSQMKTKLLNKADERKKEIEKQKKLEFNKLRKDKLQKINKL